jgi:hypothetical protein
MTAQTPAPKASGVSALLASLSSVPPPPQPSAKEEFLAVIQEALNAQPAAADNPPAAQPARDKPAPAKAAAPDPSAAGMLLALLASPLPTLLKLPARQTSSRSAQVTPSTPPSATAPAQSAVETQPAKAPAVEKPPALPEQAPPPKEPENKPLPPSGTPVADTNPRMSLSSERNEIAGRTEQKLPLAAVSALSSASSGGSSPDGGAKTPFSFSWRETPSEPLAIMDLSAKASGPPATVAPSTVDAPIRGSNPAPLERLEQIISREVITVRQTGAETLGMALRLDSNTRLFLQLTTNNGHVQASVRCERGQFAPEEAQWAQLQQSLARQNVELLPMTGGSNLNFQQPSGEHSRQPALREDWAAAGAAVSPAQPRKQKEQNRSRKNWESWA